MKYHKVNYNDCLSVATSDEISSLEYITNIAILKMLAKRWCVKNGYKLGGYLGWSKKDGESWDATLGCHKIIGGKVV